MMVGEDMHHDGYGHAPRRVTHPGFAAPASALAEEIDAGKATPPQEGINLRALCKIRRKRW